MSVARAILRKVASLARRTGGWAEIGRQAVAALRCLAFPRLLYRMIRQGYTHQIARRRLLNRKAWDPLHFMSGNGYLVRGWPTRKRFAAALYHYERDAELHDDAYLSKVEDRSGLLLWSSRLDGHHYDLRLIAPEDERCEGDLCVQVNVDGTCVACMAFAWIDGAVLGGGVREHSILVTRNQTRRVPELDAFRTSFKQNSPAHFCFAALCAIAQMHGMKQIYGIRHDRQLCYRAEYAEGFRNSYTAFWERFGGEGSHECALKISIPLELVDVHELKPSHRSRAARRRAHWAEVATHTRAVLEGHRRIRARSAELRHADHPNSLTGLFAYWLSLGHEWAHIPLALV